MTVEAKRLGFESREESGRSHRWQTASARAQEGRYSRPCRRTRPHQQFCWKFCQHCRQRTYHGGTLRSLHNLYLSIRRVHLYTYPLLRRSKSRPGASLLGSPRSTQGPEYCHFFESKSVSHRSLHRGSRRGTDAPRHIPFLFHSFFSLVAGSDFLHRGYAHRSNTTCCPSRSRPWTHTVLRNAGSI